MDKIKIYNSIERPNFNEKRKIVDFLYEHLEQYGDPKADVERAVNYAIKEIPSFGGFILVLSVNGEISGTTVINRTGMKGYIPENVLVYIATHKDMRGKGIGKRLMQKAIELTNGNIALHVEPDNPARFLYKKVGFKNKYLEMRLIK
jgi:ribosomal-protein-alanine N-acetyltransferase